MTTPNPDTAAIAWRILRQAVAPAEAGERKEK
jgi:hypothetical protein